MHLHIPDTIEYLESIQYVEIIHTILGEHTILRGRAVIQKCKSKKNQRITTFCSGIQHWLHASSL